MQHYFVKFFALFNISLILNGMTEKIILMRATSKLGNETSSALERNGIENIIVKTAKLSKGININSGVIFLCMNSSSFLNDIADKYADVNRVIREAAEAISWSEL